jgi:hypothetical protein
LLTPAETRLQLNPLILPLTLLIAEEERMKRSWTVRRQPQAVLDAEQRWDRAFQHLLRCANPAPPPLAVVQAAAHEEVVRVALYARVSTNRQVLTQSIDQQLDRLREYVVSQGWPLSDDAIFRDDGHSGATLNRPGLDRLRDKVRAAEVDRILLTAPNRLARNYVHQMVLLEELERTGCQVQFLDRPMTADPHDHLRKRFLMPHRLRWGWMNHLVGGFDARPQDS